MLTGLLAGAPPLIRRRLRKLARFVRMHFVRIAHAKRAQTVLHRLRYARAGCVAFPDVRIAYPCTKGEIIPCRSAAAAVGAQLRLPTRPVPAAAGDAVCRRHLPYDLRSQWAHTARRYRCMQSERFVCRRRRREHSGAGGGPVRSSLCRQPPGSGVCKSKVSKLPQPATVRRRSATEETTCERACSVRGRRNLQTAMLRRRNLQTAMLRQRNPQTAACSGEGTCRPPHAVNDTTSERADTASTASGRDSMYKTNLLW